MRAFVIGAQGYLGQRMTSALEMQNWKVFTFDKKMDYELGIILRDLKQKFDLVVNCSGEGGEGPKEFIDNAMTDVMIFNWAINTQQKRMLYFSNADVYPEVLHNSALWPVGETSRTVDRFIRLKESDSTFHPSSGIPRNNSGWASKTGELAAQAVVACGVKVHTLRLFSYYGEGLPNTHLFARVKESVRTGSNVSTDSLFIRDWMHITDVVNGALAVLKNDVPGPVNLCTGEGTSIVELYQEIRKVLAPGSDAPVRYEGRTETAQVGDPSLLEEIYQPQVNLKSGIRHTLRWG